MLLESGLSFKSSSKDASWKVVIQSSSEFLEQEDRDQQQAQVQAQAQPLIAHKGGKPDEVFGLRETTLQGVSLGPDSFSIIKEDNEKDTMGELRKRNNQDRNAYIEGNDFKDAINAAMDK